MKKFLLLFILFIFIPSISWGATYYVSAVNPVGNNNNLGTDSASPWQSISKVNTVSFAAGDVIKFNSGDYGTTSLLPLTSGSAGSLITFTSYDNAATKPILRGGVNLNNKNYIKLDKLDLTSTAITITVAGGNHNIITNCNIYSTALTWGPTISFRNGSTYNQLTYNTISQAQSFNDIINLRNTADYNLIAFNNITIQNSHAAIDLEGWTIDDGGTPVGNRTSNYNIIKGNKIRGHNGGGVHITLQANAFYNVVEGNDLRGDGTLSSFCYLLHPSQQPSRSQAILKGVGNYNIIRNNILADYPCQDSEGLFFDTYEYGGFNNGVTNTMIYGNVVTGIGSGGTGLYIAIGGGTGTISNNYIKNNIFFNNGGLTWTRDLDGAVSTATALTQMREHLDANYYNNNIIYSTRTSGVVWLGDNYYSVAQADANSLKWDSNYQVDPKLDPLTLLPLANSPAIAKGANLTTITSASGTGSSFNVENARYFSDGNSLITGDLIQVNGVRTTITNITYGTGLSGTLYVTPDISWTTGMAVNIAFDGAAPPIGLFASTGEGEIITPVLPTSLAINVGGSSYTNGSGITYIADNYGTGGAIGVTATAINNTTDDVIYQDERWGSSFSYSIPIQNGTYNVILSFAELFWTASERRLFTITAEGSLITSPPLDIFAQAGANTAYDLVFPITVSDELLNLNFLASIDNASLRAIRITPLTTVSVYASPSGHGVLDASTPTPATVNIGSTTSFTFNASPNYHVSSISGCGGQAYSNTNSSIASHTYTTGTISTTCTVSADFALNQYTLSFAAGSNGTISGVASQTIDAGGSSSALLATPSSGYHFTNWTGTNGFISTTDNPLTVSNVLASQTITANFAINEAPAVNGVCGSSHGASLQTIPINNLCSSGTPSSVSGNGPWSWSCVGTNGGTTASCIAARNFCASAKIYLSDYGFITGSFM